VTLCLFVVALRTCPPVRSGDREHATSSRTGATQNARLRARCRMVCGVRIHFAGRRESRDASRLRRQARALWRIHEVASGHGRLRPRALARSVRHARHSVGFGAASHRPCRHRATAAAPNPRADRPSVAPARSRPPAPTDAAPTRRRDPPDARHALVGAHCAPGAAGQSRERVPEHSRAAAQAPVDPQMRASREHPGALDSHRLQPVHGRQECEALLGPEDCPDAPRRAPAGHGRAGEDTRRRRSPDRRNGRTDQGSGPSRRVHVILAFECDG
jgi:hypothetical protein